MIGRRSRTLGIVALVLALAGLAATQLRSVSSADLLVGAHSREGKAGAALERDFGQDPIVVSVRGDLRQLLTPDHLTGLLALEGRLADLPGVKSVYGPGTFLNQSVAQTQAVLNAQTGGLATRARQIGDAARAKAKAQGKDAAAAQEAASQAIRAQLADPSRQLAALLTRFGTTGLPDLANTSFINTIVFGATDQPKPRLRWLFPDDGHVLILVRPQAGLGEGATLRLGRQVRDLAQQSRTIKEAPVQDASFEVAGLPLLAAALERETRSEILRLAPWAVGVMLLLLLAVLWRRRGRFVALGSALGAVLLTLGLSWPLGLGLSVATVAALPVVLGLGLDFAVQTQARFWLERQRGLDAEAAARAARRGVAPTLGLAAGVMALGFVVLMAGSVPIIDRLGAVLALGTLSAAGLALVAVPPVLVALDRGRVKPLALRGMPDRLNRTALRPIAATVVCAIAVGGLAVSGTVKLQSDLTVLSPRGLPALKDVQALQKEIGTAGQLSVAVRARDVTDPQVVRWLSGFGARVVKAEPRLRPGPNLADFLTGGDATATPDRRDIDGTLKLLPPYFVDAVLSPDRSTAELTYSIPFVSVAEQGRIADRVRGLIGSPPAGTTVTTTGLVAESAQSARSLDASRPWLLLLAAGAISLVLWLRWRNGRRVALVLAPALLAAGISSLVMALSGVTLSPLGAALEPLVLAIGLEFGMLLDMGYRQARRRGLTPLGARRVATRDIGGAVGLSAATVAAGFGVLSLSRLPLLSQLGWLVALELGLCLVLAVVCVPLVSEWLDLPRGAGRRRRAVPPAAAPVAALPSADVPSAAPPVPAPYAVAPAAAPSPADVPVADVPSAAPPAAVAPVIDAPPVPAPERVGPFALAGGREGAQT